MTAPHEAEAFGKKNVALLASFAFGDKDFAPLKINLLHLDADEPFEPARDGDRFELVLQERFVVQAPVEGVESQEKSGIAETPEPQRRPGVFGALFGWIRPPVSVKVEGALSQPAVEEIVDTIQLGKRLRAREELFRGEFGKAWVSYQFARYSTVEAIHEKEDGSVDVVSTVSFPDQAVIRHSNEMRGWTANWKGTREKDAPSHNQGNSARAP